MNGKNRARGFLNLRIERFSVRISVHAVFATAVVYLIYQLISG